MSETERDLQSENLGGSDTNPDVTPEITPELTPEGVGDISDSTTETNEDNSDNGAINQRISHQRYLESLGEASARSELLRQFHVEALSNNEVRKAADAESRQAVLRGILANLIKDHASESTAQEQPVDEAITPSETDEASVKLINEYLGFVEGNKATASFQVQRGLAWFKYGLNFFRTSGARTMTERALKPKFREGWVGRGVTVVATAAGGFVFSKVFGVVPGLRGLATGLAVQQYKYAQSMGKLLEKEEGGTTKEAALEQVRETNQSRSWLGRMWDKGMERIRANQIVTASRRIDEDYIYQLGVEAGYDPEKLELIERYTAALQNAIDERMAAGHKIAEDDPDYLTLLAGLQVIAGSVVNDEEYTNAEAGLRATGLENSFKQVGEFRRDSLKYSTAWGVVAGTLVGAIGSLFTQGHTNQPERVHGAANTAGPAPVEAPVVPNTTSPVPGAVSTVPIVETTPVPESLSEHIHSATSKIFGITKENAENIDSAHAEHLVRAQILHDLNIGHADVAGNIEFTAADKSWLTDHGIVFNTDGNLDFSQAHGLIGDKDVTAVITEHLNQWEQVSDPMVVTPFSPELTDVARNMQLTQMDHELMLTVSRDYKMDLAELRELRWESGSDVSKLFADHKQALQALLKDHELKIGDKLLKLEQAQGTNPMEKTRWIMRQWLESRKVAGLQINPDVSDTVAVEPERHWFFGTPIQPAVDQVVPTAHPVFGAARSTVGQAHPLNLTYSTPNFADKPNPFEAVTRHSLSGLNPDHTAGVAGHNLDAHVSANGLDQHPTTGSAPREALPTASRVEVAKPNQVEIPKARVNVVDSDGHAAEAGRATTTPLRPNMTGEVAKPNLAETKSGLNPLSTPAAKVEHPNSLEHVLFGKSTPEASGQPLPAIADRVPATVEGPSVDADDTSMIPSLQESD